MITKIIRIHGSSSLITFECEDERINAGGEFQAKDGKIAGFTVSKASLKHENGKRLTFDEQEELICRYEEYANQPYIQKDWILEFD